MNILDYTHCKKSKPSSWFGNLGIARRMLLLRVSPRRLCLSKSFSTPKSMPMAHGCACMFQNIVSHKKFRFLLITVSETYSNTFQQCTQKTSKNIPPTSFRSHGHLEPSCGLLTFCNRSTAVLRLEAFLGARPVVLGYTWP